MNSGVMSPFFKSIPSFLQRHERGFDAGAFSRPGRSSVPPRPLRPAPPPFWPRMRRSSSIRRPVSASSASPKPTRAISTASPRPYGLAWPAGLPAAAAPWIYGWCAYLAALAALLVIAGQASAPSGLGSGRGARHRFCPASVAGDLLDFDPTSNGPCPRFCLCNSWRILRARRP